MSRPEPIIPVSAKMYRHFAAITVTFTACLAMFADGEKREAIAEQISNNRQQHELRLAEQDLARKGKGGNTSFKFNNKRKSKGSFGADPSLPGNDNSSVGASARPELVAVPAVTFSGPVKSPIPGVEIPESPPPGMTIQEFEQLRRQALNRQPKARKPARGDVDQFIEASEARSQTRKY